MTAAASADLPQYLETQDASTLAACLRRDQNLCKSGLRPSPLALFLPPATSPLADAISNHLVDRGCGETEVPVMSKPVRRLWYTSVVQGLRDHLVNVDTKKMGHPKPLLNTGTIITSSDLEAASKVLEHLQVNPNTQVTSATSLEDVLTVIQEQLSFCSERQNPYHRNKQEGQRKCYICRYIISNPHAMYPSLCHPCGSFNVAESSLSLPPNLSLSSKTALVTGGRVNLGFHCALRLLRCGARTIVSTRYPLDAESRYRAENDFQDWKDRLKIVGADFRTAKDALRLVAAVKITLREWGEGQGFRGDKGLFLLVNNAAQTLTDSIQSEANALKREEDLRRRIGLGTLQVECDGDYRARIRGGVLGAIQEMNGEELNLGNGAVSLSGTQDKSSWTQSLAEIPYEDMVTAHSVNAFVPLILCRELLSIMGSELPSPREVPRQDLSSQTLPTATHDRPPLTSNKPLGYIVNVSSREGIFESWPKSKSKSGFHVHTNMSKAALNMLTETEAAQMWDTRRVAMNTVDPGYMSAAPEFQKKKGFRECPIGFEDGAARVLWPVAIGETQGAAIWGRFLKHFGKVDVEIGQGR